jgi:dsRNA-specific ribonuclease
MIISKKTNNHNILSESQITSKIQNSNDYDDIDNNYNPYNQHNVEITEDDIYKLFAMYGLPPSIKINNIKLYKRAFIHKSYIQKTHAHAIKNPDINMLKCPDDCLKLSSKSNERLEFLGDGVLELITKYYLYRRFPKENEGFMTEKKIAIVKNESIGKLALDMKLNKWLIISRGAEETNTRYNIKKLGCLFEAFLGALFLDCNKINVDDQDDWFKTLFVTGPGLQVAQILIENIFEKYIDWSTIINIDDNYKKILQVKIQKRFKVTPYYIELNEDGTEKNNTTNYENDIDCGYIMGVYLCIGQNIYNPNKICVTLGNDINSFDDVSTYLENNGHIYMFMGKAHNKIKRKAEQDACNNILKILNE